MNKRTRISAIVAMLMVTAGAAWAASGAARPSTAVLTATASKAGKSSAGLVAPALVEAAGDVVSLAFDGSGRVVDVRVREGDRVVAGDVLATLDDRLARASVAKATASLAAAEARAAAADNGARSDEISAAGAEAAAADAQAAERERQAARANDLFTGGAIGAAQLDGERTAAEAARGTAAAARARLALLRAGTRIEERRAARAEVLAARAELEEANTRLAQTVLRAPSDGTILRRFAEPGEQVTTVPPTVILTVADLDHVRLRAEVDEADIGRVSVGERGTLAAEALGDRTLSAKVIRVERELGRKKIRVDDPRARVDTRVLEVVMEVETTTPLPLGLRGDVHFSNL